MPDPQNPDPEEEYRPEPVPPAQQEPVEQPPYVVPPAQESAPAEQVYDYTQGGDQPQIYEQPAEPIDPYANDAVQQPIPAATPEPVPVPVPVPAPAPTPQTVVKRPKGAPPRRQAQAKAAAGGGRPGYRGRPGQTQYQPPADTGFSVMSVLMMLVALVLLILAIMVLTPSNLSDIKGYAGGESGIEEKKEPRNLLKEAQAVMLGDEEIKFSEEEVNQYLASRLKGSQSGAFGSMMKFKGVCVDFTPGVAEIYVERSFIGIPVTMSTRVKLNRSGNTTNWQTAGGRIGKLNLNSEKQFAPILEAYLRLAATCKEEVTVIDSMSKVKFENDMLVLDSR